MATTRNIGKIRNASSAIKKAIQPHIAPARTVLAGSSLSSLKDDEDDSKSSSGRSVKKLNKDMKDIKKKFTTINAQLQQLNKDEELSDSDAEDRGGSVALSDQRSSFPLLAIERRLRPKDCCSVRSSNRAKGDLRVEWCPTVDMIGDYMTKPLQGALFRKFRDLIMEVTIPTKPKSSK